MKTRFLGPCENVRLRSTNAEEYVQLCTPFYQDEEVLRFSEDGADPYEASTVRRMFEVMSQKGEVYIIEIRQGLKWQPIGDASLLSDAMPIAIGNQAFRSCGIGSIALSLLITRARELGWKEIKVDGVLSSNERALRMFRRAGFRELADTKVSSASRKWVRMHLEIDEGASRT